MTLEEFNELLTIEKATYFWEEGSFTDSYDIGPFRVMLYLVDDFYVEVYNHRSTNKITLMSTFDNINCLQPYLKDINIGALFDKL